MINDVPIIQMWANAYLVNLIKDISRYVFRQIFITPIPRLAFNIACLI